MRTNEFGRALRAQRKQLNRSLKQLAEEIGIDFRTLSKLELGQREPTEQQLATLTQRLHLELHDRPVFHQSLLAPFRDQSGFRPVGDRALRVRIGSVLDSYGPARALLRQLSRPNRAFLERIRCDSAPELYAWLLLLDAGARPVMAAPQRRGARCYAIVDPSTRLHVGDCCVPSLVLGAMLLVLQVSLMTEEGAVFTVDALVLRAGRWCILEIDGLGHNHARNKTRERALVKYDTVRILEADLQSDVFVQRLTERIAGLAEPRPLPDARRAISVGFDPNTGVVRPERVVRPSDV